MPAPICILCDLGVLSGQFAFLYVDLRLRDLRALTRSLPLILPCRAPCGSLPSGFPSRLGRVSHLACCSLCDLRVLGG